MKKVALNTILNLEGKYSGHITLYIHIPIELVIREHVISVRRIEKINNKLCYSFCYSKKLEHYLILNEIEHMIRYL